MAQADTLAASLTALNPHRALLETERGYLLLARHRPVDAEKRLRDALMIWSHSTYGEDARAAHIDAVIGMALIAQGRKDEARATLTHSVEVLTRQFGAGHPWTREASDALRSLS